MASRTMCGRCGAYLSVASGARSVRCPLCQAVSRVERRPHGLHHAAVGFSKGLTSIFKPPHPQPSLSSHSHLLVRSYPRIIRGCKKRALLVGISYAGTKYELKGAVNDVNCMGLLLRERFKFPSDCILVMTQDEQDPHKLPTKDNLRQAMRWLVEGTSYSGDSLVFHFSGHGVQKLDTNGDEVDGYDEALCAMDFEERGVLLHDEVNSTIVRPLGTGVTLHAIIDTCHSGTILDLPYLCRISRC